MESLSASQTPRETSQIIAEYCLFSFKKNPVSGRADPCPGTLPSLLKAGGAICWELKEGRDAKKWRDPETLTESQNGLACEGPQGSSSRASEPVYGRLLSIGP